MYRLAGQRGRAKLFLDLNVLVIWRPHTDFIAEWSRNSEVYLGTRQWNLAEGGD